MGTRSRLWRRRYYDLFSRLYDRFIKLHARQDESGTRSFLVQSAGLGNIEKLWVLDVCCGTGAVLLAFEGCISRGNFFGCDFSRGMLRRVYPCPKLI